MQRRLRLRASTIATIAAIAAITRVGPAIIQSVLITLPPELGGKTYSSWGDAVKLLRERGADAPTYWNYEGGEALGVQGERELIRVEVPSELATTLVPMLTQINVEIEYTSIYRQKFRASLRK